MRRAKRGVCVGTVWLLLSLWMAACAQGGEPAATKQVSMATMPAETAAVVDTPGAVRATATAVAGLSAEEVATLDSLEQLDAYPLYTMHYYGAHEGARQGLNTHTAAGRPSWGCSLFAALGDERGMLYGRNFDWEFSPTLMLFTDPPDGYASVAMVDIAYLDFGGAGARDLDALPLDERVALLDAPRIPFDGMNEHGLVVGMAAVPAGNVRPDPLKPTVGSLGIIREMLDHARTVDEALGILKGYNVDMGGGPPVHYLIADNTGRALLLEFYQGKLHVLANEAPWHLATNFLRASVTGDATNECARYDRLAQRLSEAGGQLAMPEAMALLSDVSQGNTQWSVVYGLQSGQIQVVMGRTYGSPSTLQLKMTTD